MSFKETRELEGMEAQIHALEAEIARIESLFADPDFFRKHAAQVNQLTSELDAAKSNVPKLYARWEELEAVKSAMKNCRWRERLEIPRGKFVPAPGRSDKSRLR